MTWKATETKDVRWKWRRHETLQLRIHEHPWKMDGWWLTGSASSSIFTDLGCIPKSNCLSGELFWCVFLLTFGGEFLGIWASHDSAPRNFHHPLWGVQSNGFYSWRFKWGFVVGNNMKQLKRHEMTYTAPIIPMKWIYFLVCLVFTCFDLIIFCSSEKLQWWPWSPFPGDVTLTGLDSQTYLVWHGFLSLFFGEKNLTALAGVLAVFTSLGKVPVAFCFGKVCNL